MIPPFKAAFLSGWNSEIRQRSGTTRPWKAGITPIPCIVYPEWSPFPSRCRLESAGRMGGPVIRCPTARRRNIRRQPPRPPRMKFRRMDFSRAECFENTAMGKWTSARRLHALGIVIIRILIRFLSRLPYYPFYYPLLRVLPFFMLAPQSTGTPSQTFNISFGLKVPKYPANHIPAYARASSLQIAERKFSRKLSYSRFDQVWSQVVYVLRTGNMDLYAISRLTSP